MKVKFNFKQLSKPTPRSINIVNTIISTFLPAFLTWVNSDNNLFSDNATHVINSVGSLIILLSNLARPMFGLQVPDASMVQAKDVDVMKSDAKVIEKKHAAGKKTFVPPPKSHVVPPIPSKPKKDSDAKK